MFGLTATRMAVEKAAEGLDLAGAIELRMDRDVPYENGRGKPHSGCIFWPYSRCRSAVRRLAANSGVVEHGLFLDLASAAIIAGASGIKTMKN